MDFHEYKALLLKFEKNSFLGKYKLNLESNVFDFKNIEKLKSITAFFEENGKNNEAIEETFIQIKYSGYIAREKDNAEKITRLENIKIPENFDYEKLASLSNEAKQNDEKQFHMPNGTIKTE